MRRLALAAATCGWLVCISLPIVMGMIFDQRGYPDNEEQVGNLLSLVWLIATLCWGFVLGRLGTWGLMVASAIIGAGVTTFLGELSLRLVYRGDPSGPIVALMFGLVVFGVVLTLGGLLGRWSRRRRPKHEV
jgi:hypothetical protein